MKEYNLSYFLKLRDYEHQSLAILPDYSETSLTYFDIDEWRRKVLEEITLKLDESVISLRAAKKRGGGCLISYSLYLPDTPA